MVWYLVIGCCSLTLIFYFSDFDTSGKNSEKIKMKIKTLSRIFYQRNHSCVPFIYVAIRYLNSITLLLNFCCSNKIEKIFDFSWVHVLILSVKVRLLCKYLNRYVLKCLVVKQEFTEFVWNIVGQTNNEFHCCNTDNNIVCRRETKTTKRSTKLFKWNRNTLMCRNSTVLNRSTIDEWWFLPFSLSNLHHFKQKS